MAVQGELQTTTERHPVDEGEGRHPRRMQLVEHGMADARYGQSLIAVDDLGELGKIGACRQDEGLGVIAIATTSSRASAASRARLSSPRPRAPKVLGRV